MVLVLSFPKFVNHDACPPFEVPFPSSILRSKNAHEEVFARRKLDYAPPLLCDMCAQLDRRLLLHGRCRRVVLSLVPSSSGNRSVSAQNSDASY